MKDLHISCMPHCVTSLDITHTRLWSTKKCFEAAIFVPAINSSYNALTVVIIFQGANQSTKHYVTVKPLFCERLQFMVYYVCRRF